MQKKNKSNNKEEGKQTTQQQADVEDSLKIHMQFD